MANVPFLAIRVVIEIDGKSNQRDYVRAREQHIGRDRFIAQSIGQFMLEVGAVNVQPKPQVTLCPTCREAFEGMHLCSVDGGRYVGRVGPVPSLRVHFFELTWQQVVDNRKYQHTTHREV